MNPSYANALHTYFSTEWRKHMAGQFSIMSMQTSDALSNIGALPKNRSMYWNSQTLSNIVSEHLHAVDTMTVRHLMRVLSTTYDDAADQWNLMKHHPGGHGVHGLAHYLGTHGGAGIQWAKRAGVNLNSLNRDKKTLLATFLNAKNEVRKEAVIGLWVHHLREHPLEKQAPLVAKRFFDAFQTFALSHFDAAIGLAEQLIAVNADTLKKGWVEVKSTRMPDSDGLKKRHFARSVGIHLCRTLNAFYALHNTQDSTDCERRARLEQLLHHWYDQHGFNDLESKLFDTYLSEASSTPPGTESSLARYAQHKLASFHQIPNLHPVQKKRTTL